MTELGGGHLKIAFYIRKENNKLKRTWENLLYKFRYSMGSTCSIDTDLIHSHTTLAYYKRRIGSKLLYQKTKNDQ